MKTSLEVGTLRPLQHSQTVLIVPAEKNRLPFEVSHHIANCQWNILAFWVPTPHTVVIGLFKPGRGLNRSQGMFSVEYGIPIGVPDVVIPADHSLNGVSNQVDKDWFGKIVLMEIDPRNMFYVNRSLIHVIDIASSSGLFQWFELPFRFLANSIFVHPIVVDILQMLHEFHQRLAADFGASCEKQTIHFGLGCIVQLARR